MPDILRKILNLPAKTINALGMKINAKIPWSSISAVGNSAPARLTILVPLIGYLVVYNQFIADFFFFSSVTSELRSSPPTILDLFRELKLTFLYFGLLFFGVGASLFAIFAPWNIQKYKSSEEYVLQMESAQTEWLIVDNLTKVGSAAWKGEYFENPDSYGNTSLSFTEDTFYQLDAILDFAGNNDVSDPQDSEPLEDHDSGFYNALGNVERDRVLECILSRRRVDRGRWHNLIGAIVQHRARDVFYMVYTFDEWSRFGARLSCAAMFLFGGILLAIPTVITSAEVILQIRK